MDRDDLIRLLIERGQEGVTVTEVALSLPGARERQYDYSLFDSDEFQGDVVIDHGPRGADERTMGTALHMMGSLIGRGAVLTGITDFYSPLTVSGRLVLEGWSSLPRVSRRLPTRDEMGIADPADLVAAALTAAGPGGMPRGGIAWWSDGRPNPENPYMSDVWGRCMAALRERGWDIRRYSGIVSGDALIQVAATPGAPMLPPSEVPPAITEERYDWPEHCYLYEPALWNAICSAERSWMSWTGGYGRSNPLRSYARPQWIGQPVPDGEAKRERLLTWARENGHDEVQRLAVPGSVALVIGSASDPVGIEEIAARLGVKRPTVDTWRQRGIFPDPEPTTIGGRPWWRWSRVEAWAYETERLPGT